MIQDYLAFIRKSYMNVSTVKGLLHTATITHSEAAKKDEDDDLALAKAEAAVDELQKKIEDFELTNDTSDDPYLEQNKAELNIAVRALEQARNNREGTEGTKKMFDNAKIASDTASESYDKAKTDFLLRCKFSSIRSPVSWTQNLRWSRRVCV